MSEFTVKVLDVKAVTHNVRSFRIEKPAGFVFTPGQATDLSVLKPGWEQEKRPFTFTSLPEDDTLEFTIKIYPDHNGVTKQLGMVQKGDRFAISEAWGAISYQGEGVFIAGGAGITPFLAILRHLRQKKQVGQNRLFFSNRTEADIILREELEGILGNRFFNVITRESQTRYYAGKIDRRFLENQVTRFDQPFYVCGPDAFVSDILRDLEVLGARPQSLVFEK